MTFLSHISTKTLVSVRIGDYSTVTYTDTVQYHVDKNVINQVLHSSEYSEEFSHQFSPNYFWVLIQYT